MGDGDGTDDGRRCPLCGALAADRYCARCGAEVEAAQGPDVLFTHRAGDQVGRHAADSSPTVPTRLQQYFGGQDPAAPGEWSGNPHGLPVPEFFSGWTVDQPALDLPLTASRAQRRRRALLATVGIAMATAAVLVVALVIAPKWGSKPGTDASVITPGPTAASTGTRSTGSSTSDPTGDATGGTATGTSEGTATDFTGSPTSGPGTTISVTATSSRIVPQTTPPRPPTPRRTPQPVRPPIDLGVPRQDISCSTGFVVQLAAGRSTGEFVHRVAELRAAGQLPSDARAATVASSCRIFPDQASPLVLYAGPYAHRYDGCGARLVGPADALVIGASPGIARSNVSCLCPASTDNLPRILDTGQRDVWVGELQRILGARLNIGIPDLAGNWGNYTAGTRAAVMAFQRSAQLLVDGRVGPHTWRALQVSQC